MYTLQCTLLCLAPLSSCLPASLDAKVSVLGHTTNKCCGLGGRYRSRWCGEGAVGASKVAALAFAGRGHSHKQGSSYSRISESAFWVLLTWIKCGESLGIQVLLVLWGYIKPLGRCFDCV